MKNVSLFYRNTKWTFWATQYLASASLHSQYQLYHPYVNCFTLLKSNPIPEIWQVNTAFLWYEICFFPTTAPSKMNFTVTFPGMILQS